MDALVLRLPVQRPSLLYFTPIYASLRSPENARRHGAKRAAKNRQSVGFLVYQNDTLLQNCMVCRMGKIALSPHSAVIIGQRG